MSQNGSRLHGLWLPLTVGALLRLLGLTRQPLWVDEILTLRAASIGERFLLHDVLINPQGPLPHVALRVWVDVFGSGDPSLRLWSALAGIAALALALIVLRRIWPAAAPLTGWLLALSPFQIWYSMEVRNYIFVIGATVLVLGTFQRFFERRAEPGSSIPAVLAHGAALGALMLCNLSGVFLLPALGLAVFWIRRERLAPWLVSAGIALLVAAPWIWVEFGGHVDWSGVAGTDPVGQPIRGGRTFPPGALPYSAVVFLGGLGLGPPSRLLHAGLSPDWASLAPGLVLGGVGTVLALVGLRGHTADPRIRLFAVWCTVPVVCAAVVAAVGLKAFNPRYVAFVQPVMLLLLGSGLTLLRSRRRILGTVGSVFLIAAMLQGYARQTFDPAYAKEDFRSTARYLEANTVDGDLILLQGVHGPLQRYYRGSVPIETYFPMFFGEPDGGEGRLDALADGRRKIWWVGSRLWYEDPDHRVLRWIAERGEFATSWEAPGVEVRAYAIEGTDP